MKRAIAGILAAILLLSCCAFAESVSPEEKIAALEAANEALRAENEQLKAKLAEYEAANTVYPPDSDVVTFNGGSIKLADAQAVYNSRAYFYEQFGITPDEYAEDLKQDVLISMAEDAILQRKAEELNIYTLSDADVAQVTAETETYFEETVDYYLGYFYNPDSTAEQIRQDTLDYLESEGITYDSMLNDNLEQFWKDRLMETVTADITVSEADIRAAYDSGLENARKTWSANPENYEYACADNEIVYYHPAGFRRVEYMLLPFDSDESYSAMLLTMALESADSTEAEALQQEMDVLYAVVEERFAGLIDAAGSGAAFDKLAEENGLTEHLISLPTRKNSSILVDELCDPAMALQPGELSAPIRTEDGLWLIRYVEDIAEHEVPFEELHDAIADYVLENARYQRYNELVEQWLQESGIEYHPEML